MVLASAAAAAQGSEHRPCPASAHTTASAPQPGPSCSQPTPLVGECDQALLAAYGEGEAQVEGPGAGGLPSLADYYSSGADADADAEVEDARACRLLSAASCGAVGQGGLRASFSQGAGQMGAGALSCPMPCSSLQEAGAGPIAGAPLGLGIQSLFCHSEDGDLLAWCSQLGGRECASLPEPSFAAPASTSGGDSLCGLGDRMAGMGLVSAASTGGAMTALTGPSHAGAASAPAGTTGGPLDFSSAPWASSRQQGKQQQAAAGADGEATSLVHADVACSASPGEEEGAPSEYDLALRSLRAMPLLSELSLEGELCTGYLQGQLLQCSSPLP